MKLLTIIVPILLMHTAFAQELDVEVTINTQQLTSDALDNVSDLVQQVKTYLNTAKWTRDDFGTDRIKCTMTIFVKGSPGEGRYSAQVFIGSQRRIWDLKAKRPTEKNSAMLRIFDENWDFAYTRGILLTRNEFRFDALTSFLDFYAYLVLGFDYDSYEPLAGNPYFQKALNIFNLSRSAGTPKGWEFPGSATYSRARLIDELASEKFKDFRRAIYTYHTEGLDRLASDQTGATEKVYDAVESIGKVKKSINQQSVAIKTFFDTKYLELCELFLNYPDKRVFVFFGQIDPTHQKSYDEYRQKQN